MAIKPQEYSVSALAVELHYDHRKMGALLEGLEPVREEKGKKQTRRFYLLKDALEHIAMNEDRLDPRQEQAKLNMARRIKVDIETAVMKGELCYTDDVEKLWFDTISNVKTKLRGLPHKLATQVQAATTYAEVVELLEDGVREALYELSESGTPEAPKETQRNSKTSANSAA